MSIPDGVTVLRKPDGGTVYLLGSCHVSNESAAAAAELVKRTQPSAVVVELCESRRGLLEHTVHMPKSTDSGANISIGDVALQLGDALWDWTEVMSLQYRVYDSLGASGDTGAEFRAAVEEAHAAGAEIVLGDRDMGLTRRRMRKLVPISELIWSFLFPDPKWVEVRPWPAPSLLQQHVKGDY